MTQSYVQRKPAQRQEAPKQRSELDPVQGSPTTFGADLSFSGASGHPVDLPGAIREKFENAFGADLSAVRFYRSQAVKDAGAQAVTMGEKVIFAPGMLDFSSRSGQTLLGHELSHVVSQQRGEVTGSGFLNDPALEARADREGAMAAAGEEITAPTAAMSQATAASASGPMQAKKDIQSLGNAYAQHNSIPRDTVTGNGQINNAYSGYGDTAVTAEKPFGPTKRFNEGLKAAHSGLTSASKATDTHFARTDPDLVRNGGTWGASTAASGISGILGIGSGLLTAYHGISSMIRGGKNVKAGGSKADAVEGGLQTLVGLGGIGSGSASIAKGFFSSAAKALGSTGGLKNLIPGLSIASGGVNAVLGTMQAVRGGKSWRNIGEQIEAESQKVRSSQSDKDDQQRMLRTMRHGREIQKRNALVGVSKLIGGGLTGLGGVASLGGVTSPLGLGLSAAGAAVSGVGSIYNLWKSRRLRKNAIAEELGGKSYKEIVDDVRSQLKGSHRFISRSNAWKIFLESKQKSNQSEEAIYKDIRQHRAAHMLNMAQRGNQEAIGFIESMGVKQAAQDANGIPVFAKGALDLLTEKLQ